MFLNRENIDRINEIKSRWTGKTCQTNSRLDGRFLSAVRLYADPADAGHPDRAAFTLRTADEMDAWLAAH